MARSFEAVSAEIGRPPSVGLFVRTTWLSASTIESMRYGVIIWPWLATVWAIWAICRGVVWTVYWPIELIASCAGSASAGKTEGVTASGIWESRPKPNRFVTSTSCWVVSCSEASTKVVLHERAKASVSVGLPSPQVEDSMLDTSVAVPGRVVDTGDDMRVSGSATPFSMRAIVVRTLKVEPGA